VILGSNRILYHPDHGAHHVPGRECENRATVAHTAFPAALWTRPPVPLGHDRPAWDDSTVVDTGKLEEVSYPGPMGSIG
jgi:hypothetical protein